MSKKLITQGQAAGRSTHYNIGIPIVNAGVSSMIGAALHPRSEFLDDGLVTPAEPPNHD